MHDNQFDKTKLLYVGVPQLRRTLSSPLPSATMLGTEIKPVTIAKGLGVYIYLLPPQVSRLEVKSRGGTLVTRAYIKDSSYSSNIRSVY